MTISISGTVYSDQGVTPDLAGLVLNCSVNGAASSGSTTSSVVDGTYTISGITAASGAVLTVYLQGNTPVGVTVTTSTGSNMTGVDIYENHLNLRSDDGSLTGANVHTAINGSTGISSIYSSSSVSVFSLASGKSLLVMSGQTASFPAGGTITIPGNFVNKGTLSGASNLIFVFTGTGSGGQITSNGSNLYAVEINATGGTYTLQDNLVVNGFGIELLAGTLDVSTSNYNIALGGSAGTFTVAGGAFTGRFGTVTFNCASGSTQTLVVSSGTANFFNIAHSGSVQVTQSNSVTVSGTFTNSAGTWSVASGKTLTVTGLATLSGGTLTISTSGATFNGGLMVNGGTFTSVATTVTVAGDFALFSGTFAVPSTAFNVSGNFSVTGGTFTQSTHTVALNGTAQTVNAPASAMSFYNLVMTNPGDVISFTDGTTTTVTNAFTAQHVTLQGTSTAGWTIAMPATQTIDHVTVSYSTATGHTAVAGTGSVNGGNNVNWTFPSGAVTNTPIILSYL